MSWLGRVFHQGCERETSFGSAVIGLLAGAGAGAGLTSIIATVGVALAGFFTFDLGTAVSGLMIGMAALLYSFVIWTLGLLLVGAPGWWLLHRLGARCQQAAMIYGGGATFTVCLIVTLLVLSTTNGTNVMVLLPYLALMTLQGVIVGWVVAKVAYAPVKP